VAEFVRTLEQFSQPRPAQVLAQMRHLLFKTQDDVFQALAVGWSLTLSFGGQTFGRGTILCSA